MSFQGCVSVLRADTVCIGFFFAFVFWWACECKICFIVPRVVCGDWWVLGGWGLLAYERCVCAGLRCDDLRCYVCLTGSRLLCLTLLCPCLDTTLLYVPTYEVFDTRLNKLTLGQARECTFI